MGEEINKHDDDINDVGARPVLVLLPGLDGTGKLFAPFLGALSANFDARVIAYPRDEILSYEALTQYVLDRLPTDAPYVLLGESFSGPVSIMVASAKPRGLVGVVLSASFVASPLPWARHFVGMLKLLPVHAMARTLAPPLLMGSRVEPALKQALLAAVDSVSSAVLIARLRAAANVDVSKQLAALRLPSLYLQASKDRVVPKSAAVQFAREAQTGKVCTFNCPHFVLQLESAKAADVVEQFVDECADRAKA